MLNPNLKTRTSEKLGDAERTMMLERIKEQGTKLDPNSKKTYSRLARQFAHTKGYSEEILRLVYKVATEPKMASDRYYQDFLRAFANGAFSRDSDLIQMLLKSLGKMQSDKAGPHERKTTQEILRHIGDSRGAIGERTEKNLSKQIKQAAEKDDKERAVEGKSPLVIAEIAQTGSKATDIVREKEKIHPLQLGKWTVENPPEGLMEELHKAYDEQYKLAKRAEKTTDKKELDEIDRQMDKLSAEIQPAKDTYQNYLSRALGQFRAQEQFAEEMGVSDLNNLKGLSFLNPETVRAGKKKEELKIEEISFDTEGVDPDSPGKFIVRFTDEKGHKGKEAGFPFLKNHVIALEGYEETPNPEIFDEKFGQEMRYRNIEKAAGETFEAGKQSYKKETFIVSSVERVNGKWVVKLDRKVIKIPKWRMPSSVQTSLYFDRKEQEFSLGEFGAFLKREGYRRVVGDEELQEVADSSAKANAQRCKKFMEGAPPEEIARFKAVGGDEVDELTIPAIGEKQRVKFVDQDGVTKTGFLTMSKSGEGKTTFEIEPVLAGSLAAGAKGKARVTKKQSLDGRHLMALTNKGDIQNARETHQPAREEGLVQDDFEKMSAAETISSKPDSHEHDEYSDGEHGKHGPKKKENGEGEKIYEEALDYDLVHKVGGMGKVERGFLKTMWAHTHFLSVSDLWHMGKTMWEYHLRRFERRQKERYSMVGKHLPYFAPEMQRIKQAAEIEQVNQFKESFEDFGVYEIQERLRQTHNQDELKAAFSVLAEKGQLRWDDIETWKNLNKFVEPNLAVPIPSNGDPYTTVSEKDKRTGFSFLKDAIDSLWGEGTYNEWFAKNKTTYQQSSKGYYEKGKELEGIDGGHARRLGELLRDHKEGRYVDPHEYEGLIIHSIDAGKGTMQMKIFYMIEGVAAENHEGRTIMPFDRIAHINSEMLNQFPILEYLCAKATRKGQPKGKGTRFTMDDYKQWVGWFDAGNHMNFEPTKEVDDFMWRYVIPSDDTQNRINKALRSAEKLDHDDMFAYLPPATTQIITDACGATTGAKKFLTVEGYANAFPGFSQYMRSLGENDNRKKLIDAVKSWVRFEGIMTGRFDKQKGNDVMQRMDPETLGQGTIVTPDIAPKVFMDQLNETMQAVVEAYDDKDLTNTYALLREETGDIFSNPDQMDQQKKINFAFREFDKVFDRVARKDAGKKLKDIVKAANLTGMTFLPSEEKDRRKAQRGNLLELDYESESRMPFSGGHGGGHH